MLWVHSVKKIRVQASRGGRHLRASVSKAALPASIRPPAENLPIPRYDGAVLSTTACSDNAHPNKILDTARNLHVRTNVEFCPGMPEFSIFVPAP